MHSVRMHVGAIRKLLMVCAYVWEIIHLLNSVDYLPVQTHESYMNNELLNGLCVWPGDNNLLAQAREIIFPYRRTNNIIYLL